MAGSREHPALGAKLFVTSFLRPLSQFHGSDRESDKAGEDALHIGSTQRTVSTRPNQEGHPSRRGLLNDPEGDIDIEWHCSIRPLESPSIAGRLATSDFGHLCGGMGQ